MNIDQKYSEALDYIYSYVDFSLTRNLRYKPEEFDLARVYQLLDLMDNPQSTFDIIHVAGTKGKGSICAMTASILKEAGYKVGFYSSPHMIDFRERIKVNDIDISKQSLIHYVDSHRQIFPQVAKISTFEIMTAIAFKYFADMEVDIALIEVGMGGRLDATNVVSPKISIISSISLDHVIILGDTIEKIASEKAGIIKENIPVIISPQESKAKNVIKNIAAEKNCELIDTGEIYGYSQTKYSLEKQSFILNSNSKDNNIGDDTEFSIPLLGDHQIWNAITSYAAINQLNKSGYSIKLDAISKGLSNVAWSGRFEVINKDPLIIIDGAHNYDSFEKLRKTIEKYLPDQQITLIFGVSEDKDIHSMLKTINHCVDTFIFTKSSHPRAMDLNSMQKVIDELGIMNYSMMKIEEILPKIKNIKTERTAYIASGSIFVAGAIKQLHQEYSFG